MKRICIFLLALTLMVLSFADYPNGAISSLFVIVLSLVTGVLIKNYESEDADYLTSLFLAGLIFRLGFGMMIYFFSLQDFFGGDASTYDMHGQRLIELWQGLADPNDPLSVRVVSMSGAGWGMNYITGAIYFVAGRSVLVAQSFCAVVGAATAPMVFFCAQNIFNNKRVSKISALSIAFFPSFIIWSSQLMKDGLIIFLLVCSMTMVLQLQKRFSIEAVALLIFSMFGILSLRFYIFYMVAVAVTGSFVIGFGTSAQSILRRVIAVAVIGLALTYLGILRSASDEFDRYGSLEQVNISRQDLASSANSGFGGDVDVSTTAGAITAIPLGFIYLMLAPFPWQMNNLRQVITLPEVLVWWACIPLIISGLWYAIKNRLRQGIPILLFSLMLSLAYSIFQGNVGTAYRQRTQIQVFLFIFIAVGWTLRKEKMENKKIILRQQAKKVVNSRANGI